MCVDVCWGGRGGKGRGVCGSGSSHHDCLLKNDSQFCDDKLNLMKVLGFEPKI